MTEEDWYATAFRFQIHLHERLGLTENLIAASERAALQFRGLAAELERGERQMLAGLEEMEDDFYDGRREGDAS